jgi:hypothetical protein
MSFQTIIIETEQSADSFKSNCNLSMLGLDAVNNLAEYVVGVAGGQYPSSISVNVGAVKASGTIVSTGTAANNETATILGETVTAKTSGAVLADGEFNISATPATQAASIAAMINAMPEFVGIITAEVTSGGTVTVTASVPGVIGNGLKMADVNLANVAITSFANGSNGTSYAVIDQI